ncbi:transcription factor bHLH19 isoform X1 [Brassica napus]|uniref:transcription factor bHLH19 isoform X1 n=1 Tax=Brassica napus TaxID=3708 RepID=UPI002078C798|nr:transcription factor bHLH19 isoform X1 [Brassica napus]
MDEDFFLTDFSLEDIDFDFNIYEETNVSPVEASIHTERAQFIEHQVPLNYLNEKPKPVVKINNKPRLISFDFSSNVSSSPAREDIITDQLVTRGTKRKSCSPAKRSPVFAKEHVIAERKRREKLSEKFIALSALLPGLKKADKITVLDDAISRLKQLQEQIRKLKEEKEATRHMESMILVNKSKVFLDEGTFLSSSSSSSDHEQFDQPLPEIEAKVAQNEVLIRIHCEKSKGSMIDILNTIENFQLRVENSIVLPFGESILDITILAQVNLIPFFVIIEQIDTHGISLLNTYHQSPLVSVKANQESRVQYKTCTILYLFCLPFELKFTLRVKVVQRKWQTKTCLVGIMCIIYYNALGFLDKPIYMLKLILTRLYNFRGAMYYLGIILA